MSINYAELIGCRTPGCHHLIEDAVPPPKNFRARLSPANAQKHCSLSCARHALTRRIRCQGDKCTAMVRNIVPDIPEVRVPAPDFNTSKYCSGACAGHVVCKVCAASKPLTQYLTMPKRYTASDSLVPYPCLQHLMSNFYRYYTYTTTSVCIDCITSYVVICFQDRGIEAISYVRKRCSHRRLREVDWRPYAINFLPPALHDQFSEQLFQTFLVDAQTWSCPSGCDTTGLIIDMDNASGFPQVVCEVCKGRFCASCNAAWHEGKTCQQYQLEHPNFLTDKEIEILEDMAALGARRCPRCQYVIIKDGGCSHMHCEQCQYQFNWGQAEKVSSTRGPVPKPEQESPHFPTANVDNRIESDVLAETNTPGQPSTITQALRTTPVTWTTQLRQIFPPVAMTLAVLEQSRDDDMYDLLSEDDDDDDDEDDEDDNYANDDMELAPDEMVCEMDVLASKTDRNKG